MKTLNLAFLLIIIISFFSACKLDKPVLPDQPGYITTSPPHGGNTGPGTGTGTNNGDYYFKGSMNGTAFNWQLPADNTGTAEDGSSDQGVFTGGLEALLLKTTNIEPMLGIMFKTVNVNYQQDKSAYFKNFVNTGNWPLATDDQYIVNTKTIIVEYIDSDNNSYSTINGAQTSSNANIVSVTYIPANFSSESLKIKLTFNCILYPDNAGGNTITITNGEATVRLEDLIPL